MKYSLRHLTDAALLQCLSDLVARDRATTADLLAHIAEVVHRELYAPAGYDSMSAYCVQELRLSEQAAYKRINVARVALEFPRLFEMIADGRLNLSTAQLLGPRLTPDNADQLLDQAANKTRAEIEILLAHWFPKADEPTSLRPIATPRPAVSAVQLSPGIVDTGSLILSTVSEVDPDRLPSEAPAAATAPIQAPAPVETPAPRARVTPLAPERYVLKVTIG